jgi:TRAP-type uncharacterized transport system substrate-binding protein
MRMIHHRRIVVLAALVPVCLHAPGVTAKEYKLGTGPKDGVYAQAGPALAEYKKDAVVLLPSLTGGTGDNMARALLPSADPNAVDVFIAQPDGPAWLKNAKPFEAEKLRKLGQLHVEYAHLFCGKKSGIKNLENLKGRKDVSIALGEAGKSGAWFLWQNWIKVDKGYADVVVSPKGGKDALNDVANGAVTCALVPAGLHAGTAQDADNLFGEDLILARIDGKAFTAPKDIDGSPLYESCEIPKGTYKGNLQASEGWFSSSAVGTVCWHAAVYANNTKVDPDDNDALIWIAREGGKAVRKKFGG